jgi:hypothetical protein
MLSKVKRPLIIVALGALFYAGSIGGGIALWAMAADPTPHPTSGPTPSCPPHTQCQLERRLPTLEEL